MLINRDGSSEAFSLPASKRVFCPPRKMLFVVVLVELTLIFLVATASVERVFSTISLIKTYLHNKMGDEWLNDLMICYVEKDI